MSERAHESKTPYAGPVGVWKARRSWVLGGGVVASFGAVFVGGVTIAVIAAGAPQGAVFAAAVGGLLVTLLLWRVSLAFQDTNRTIELTEHGIVDRRGDDVTAIGWGLIRDVRVYVVEHPKDLDEPRLGVLDKAEGTLLDWDRRRIARWASLHRAIIEGIRLHHGALPEEPDPGGGLSRQRGDTPRLRAALQRLRGRREPDQVEVRGPNPLIVFLLMIFGLVLVVVIVQAIG